MNEASSDVVIAKKMSVKKGGSQILSGVTFSLRRGSVTGLIGPSGSGKTTLMRCLVGVQALSDGELKVLGRPAGHKDLRRRIGYVTQKPAVYDDLTVWQNLRYFATIVGVGAEDVRRVIGEVHLEKQRDQVVGSLSGGQQARVSLAVALLGNPELLVFDEPTVGLDPVLREELWALFAELAKSGRTLLISSHVMDEAERCDDLLLLRDGTLLWKSSRVDLLKETKTHNVGAAFMAMVTRGKR